MVALTQFWENLKMFFKNLPEIYISCILEFLFCVVIFYCIFKVLQSNKAAKFIPLVIYFTLLCGFTFALTPFDSQILLIILAMMALLVFTMFHTEIKRSLLDSNVRKKNVEKRLSVSAVELIIEETTRAVQNMSKKDIGALIVLSNENLPEGIIESGTVVNAAITSQMIEAIFYPKAPLHDGAMIIEGNKIYAAGCFLPLAQSENLPKDMGSRHRAALGVTTVASVTAIVVSEETGIISIVRNGAVRKKYADAADLKNALSDYYWSDLTAEGKL